MSVPIIRTSERRTFKRCPQQWWWGWREGLRVPASEEAAALWFGTGIHLVLEHFYGPGGTKRGRRPLAVWREYARDGAMVTLPSGEVDDRTGRPQYVDAVRLGEAMIDGYMDHYGKDEHVYVLGVEVPFQIDIPVVPGGSPCVYAGKWDLLWRDMRDDGIWVTDHKTAKDMSTKHLSLDDQAGSYWALATPYLQGTKQIKRTERLKGIEYNILLKHLPPEDDRPVDADGMRLNKDGTVSKRQPKRLDQRFHRERVHRTATEQQSQIDRISIEAGAMDRMRRDKRLVYKNPTRDCSWDCAFFILCELHERGADWEDYKRMAYVQQDPYADHREALKS